MYGLFVPIFFNMYILLIKMKQQVIQQNKKTVRET